MTMKTTKTNKRFFVFMQEVIAHLRQSGKSRTAEAYTSALNSFIRFRQRKDLPLSQLNGTLLMQYETFLHLSGVTHNTSSFYLRNLRAVYNRAVEQGLVKQSYPFKHVYTGVEKTAKRAIPLTVIRRLKNLDVSQQPGQAFARDMFLFSFYTRGMSFVDMAYLRKKDLNHGVLAYRRHKTNQLLFIGWEPCMQELVDKYSTDGSSYLLPIIKDATSDVRRQYIYAAHNVNRSLRKLGERLGVSTPLTMYVARHSWASVAHSKHIPLSVISESLGHDSETTTRIYLASLNRGELDKANKIILDSL